MDVRFTSPTTLADALTAAAAGSRPVAGGTDLVVGTRQGKWSLPENLVALDRIAELRGIVRTADGLRIGATTSHADLAGHPDIRERWTAIADAASIVGSPATRHVGTLGGNIANASPAAETSGPLLCFDAQVELRSTAGDRRIALADVFSGPGRTTIHPDELIVAVVLPELDGAGSCYVRLEFRRQMEIAVVGATAVVASMAGSSATPGSPSPPSPRRSGGSPWPRPRSSGRMAGRKPPRRRAGWRPRRRRRSRTSAPRSNTAGRWRPSSSVEPSRERSLELAGRRSRSLPVPAPFGAR